MAINEGYIKFECRWENKEFNFPKELFQKINDWRDRLYNKGFLGMTQDGIGFGNISIRIGETKNFIITGSATGGKEKLEKKDYAMVFSYGLKRNVLFCSGGTKASSESLSHAAIYESRKDINAVIHTHNIKLWTALINKKPTTDINAEYGTPEIAFSIKKLMKNPETIKEKIIIMAGHEEGIITFGEDLGEAGDVLLNFLF